jgi:hypothetical protein
MSFFSKRNSTTSKNSNFEQCDFKCQSLSDNLELMKNVTLNGSGG